MWRWLWLILLVIGLWLMPIGALADSSQDVTVTAVGWICEAPGGFTITYVSDFEVGLSWVKPEDVDNTMIRVRFGDFPVDREDGYLVYYGDGESCSDANIDLTMAQVPSYRAWSQRDDGVWEAVGVTEEAGFMSASFLFIGLIAIAGLLTIMQFRWHFLPLAMAAAMGWLATGLWLLLGDVTNLGLETAWAQVLALLFILMVFVPLLWFIMRMGKREMTVTGPQGTYKTWGKPDKDARSRSQLVKDSHRSRLASVGGRRNRRSRG